MAVTIPEARALVIAFCRSYPIAGRLTYCLRNMVEELYGFIKLHYLKDFSERFRSRPSKALCPTPPLPSLTKI